MKRGWQERRESVNVKDRNKKLKESTQQISFLTSRWLFLHDYKEARSRQTCDLHINT